MREQILQILDEVMSGNTDPLKAYIQLKEVENILSDALKEINDQAIDEALKYEKKSFQYLNAKISVKNNAGRWDYTHIPQWNDKKKELKEVEDKAQQSYQSRKKGLYAISEDGEAMEPAKFTEGKLNISVQIINNQITEKLPFE